jgi:hypothetical protein
MTDLEECPHVSPDCRDGNHHKCDGAAWCMADDDYVICHCDCGRCGRTEP